MPMKPLSFKGDKKTSKKRKHNESTHTTSLSHQSQDFRQDTTHTDDDDSWTSPSTVTDLTGPTIIVLPTQPPTCLASDANGRIFASPLENIIEGNPHTAEPHDVRQVWVATRVPGTGTGSEVGEVGFKGAHGGWLSCDSVGVLGAVREARGTEEGFVVEDANAGGGGGDGRSSRGSGWLLRTAATKKSDGDKGKKYICAVIETSKSQTQAQASTRTGGGGGGDEEATTGEGNDESDSRPKKKISVSLRGDGEADDDSSRLILRMQARFLPKSAAVAAQQKSKEKVSRQELEKAVGRRLEEEEVRKLKRAKRHGTYHEEILDMRAKGSHDKFA